MLADPYADPGIDARMIHARLPENSSDNGFCLFLYFYSFTVAYQWFISKKIRGGGGPTYSRGGGGRGLGVQMLILETHRNLAHYPSH